MDQQLVSHYARKFGAYDRDEIGDLVARRADLSDEATAGLDEALRNLGLRDVDVYAPPSTPATRTEEEVTAQLVADTQRARELWRGGLATASKLLMGLIFIAPVHALLKNTQVGALWVGLALLIAGCAGYWVGRGIAKRICADGEAEIGAKRRLLWVFFGALVVLYFIVYAIS